MERLALERPESNDSGLSLGRHTLCFSSLSTPEYSPSGGDHRAVPMLSPRSHFWLRFVGLAIILAAEFGPRLWSSAQTASAAPLEASAESR
jgi:hypothetical protein